jgi:general stress protein 26
VRNIKKDVIEIIGSCDVAFLSTINLGKFPETRAMSNALNRSVADDLSIHFAAHTISPKFGQIEKNDNASLYYFIPENMKNMILFGKIEPVNDKSLKSKLWIDEFATYYKNGKDDELYGVLKFIPTGYKYYDHSSDGVTEKVEGKF